MNMAYARKRAGLLQRQVAEALGVSLGTVAMWDTGRNKPRVNMLPRIANLYGCTVDDLLNEAAPHNTETEDQRGDSK